MAKIRAGRLMINEDFTRTTLSDQATQPKTSNSHIVKNPAPCGGCCMMTYCAGGVVALHATVSTAPDGVADGYWPHS